jgi:hypothetical protein
VDQVQVPQGSRQPSLQLLPTLCYLQGWIPRGVDQLVDVLPGYQNLIPLKESADKTRIFRTLLKGQALSYFEHNLRRRLDAEESELPDNELIVLVIREL